VGWNLLLGLAVFWTSRNLLLRAFAVVMPIAMFLSTVVTGNHFIIDGLAGSVVALIGLILALALAKRSGLWAHLTSRRRRAVRPSSGA
jgi:membrane-associated phospholipid phosphatase